MPIINKRFYHKVKKSELEDNFWNYIKRNKYENITFASNIQKIENFHYSKMLKSLFVPGTVDEIKEDSFNNCEKLEEVILQEGLKTIGDGCFWNCENLKKIIIPSSVDSLGYECFGECLNLKIIVLPINYLDVPSHVFNNCYHIEKVNYQSLNLEFLQTIEERVKKEKRTEKNKEINKEVAEKMFYFGKCKLLGINYKQEYEEFIEYYMNTYTIPNKDVVSLDKVRYLKKEENKLIPWYVQHIPGFIISEYLNSDNNKEVEPLDYISQSLEYNSLPPIEDDRYYFDKKGNLWVKDENGDDIMPKPFVKKYIFKNNK